MSQKEGKTNFLTRLKQFDGLTWLTLTPHIISRSRIFLPHITRTPAMYSRIFRSRILHLFSPALPHFINTHF